MGGLSSCARAELICVDDDASPQVLETMEAAAYIHMDATITPRVGLFSNNMPDDKASLGEQVLVMNGVLGKLYNTLVSSDPSNSNVSLQVSFANKGFLRMFNLSQMIRERHFTSRGPMEPTTLRAPFRKV